MKGDLFKMYPRLETELVPVEVEATVSIPEVAGIRVLECKSVPPDEVLFCDLESEALLGVLKMGGEDDGREDRS